MAEADAGGGDSPAWLGGLDMFSAPQTIRGPLRGEVGGQWVDLPAFTAYGSKTIPFGEGEAGGTIYYDQKGNPITDPLQDPKYGSGIPGNNYFNINPDGTTGDLYGSTSGGSPSTAADKYGAYLALAGLGGFAGAAAAGVGAGAAAGGAEAAGGAGAGAGIDVGSAGTGWGVGGAADAIDVGVPGLSSPASAAGALGAAEALGGSGGAGDPTAQVASASQTDVPVGDINPGDPGYAPPDLSGGAAPLDAGTFGFDGAGLSAPGGGLPGGSFDPTAYETGVSQAAAQSAGTDAVTTPPVAEGGADSILQRILASAKKNPMTALSLGSNLVKGLMQMRKGDQLSKDLAAAGKPASEVGQSLLADYQSGKVPAGTQFDINKWKDQAIAAARSRYGSMGNSSALRNAIDQINAQAASMTDKARQGLLQSGLQAIGVGQGPITQAALASANADTNFANATGSALNSLMLLQAMQKSGGTAAAAG